MDKQRIQELAGIVVKDVGEPTVQKVAVGHVDREKHMVRKRLYNLAKYAQELDDIVANLPDNADFPGWWQDKITMADECLGKAKHYLEAELAVPKD